MKGTVHLNYCVVNRFYLKGKIILKHVFGLHVHTVLSEKPTKATVEPRALFRPGHGH